MTDELKGALLEFVQELHSAGIRVFLAGGYGLYVRQISLLGSALRTYLNRDAWPRPRATADLDVFLPTEIIVDHGHMTRVRKVLDELRYQPVPLKYLHFERQGATGPIRIELLTGPIDAALADRVRVKDFRIRPRKAIELHAYLTNEALDLELDPVEVLVDGTTVLVPNSFSFLLMKIHAFRDRMDQEREDEDRQLGRHHALDVYRVIAMLTEEETAFVRSRCTARRDAEPLQTAARVVAEYFATPSSLGVLRLREHPLAGDHLQIDPFVSMLGDLFGPGPR